MQAAQLPDTADGQIVAQLGILRSTIRSGEGGLHRPVDPGTRSSTAPSLIELCLQVVACNDDRRRSWLSLYACMRLVPC